MQTKKLPLVQRVAILLECPATQDSSKEYAAIQQAYTDLSYGVDVEPEDLAMIQDKLEQFNI